MIFSRPFKFCIIGLLILCGCSFIQSKEDILRRAERIKRKRALPGPVVKTPKVFIPLPEYEELTYKAKYLGITVGELKTTIKGKTTFKNRPAYHFEMTAKTTGIFTKIYNVEDKFVSYMDAEKHVVLRHEEYRKEGNYRKESIVDFDYEKNTAAFFNRVDNSRKEVKIKKDLHDMLTANYFIRMIRWELGDTIDLKIYADEKIYDILGFIKSTAQIRVPKKGMIDAFVFVPYAYLDGKSVKKASATGYFEIAGAKIPLKGLVKTPVFGNASITLYDVKAK